MKPQTIENKPLSARWTFAEHDGIRVDKLGHADITSWARGTSGPHRPEVGRVERVRQPIHILANLVPIEAEKLTDRPDPTMVLVSRPIVDNGPEIVAKRAARNEKISEAFARHYDRTVKRVGHEMTDARPELEPIGEQVLKAWLVSHRSAEVPRS